MLSNFFTRRKSNQIKRSLGVTASKRLIVAVGGGVITAAILISTHQPTIAPLTAWNVAIIIFGVWTWLSIGLMDSARTAAHAVREEPGRSVADILLITASLASLIGVGFILVASSNAQGITKALYIGLGIISVVLSWGLVHTIYTLRYARLYYSNPSGGIDFNQKDRPSYPEFAYLALTIGMTFQVSDTNLQTKVIRITALKHALLSYLFGTVIVATTINLVAGLSK